MTDAASYWRLSDLLDRLERSDGPPRKTLRRWMHSAQIVRRNGVGVPIVTRDELEAKFPELLEELRRRDRLAGVGGTRAETRNAVRADV